MKSAAALKTATELLTAFIENQEIPPGAATGTAASHGEKTAQFLTAMHRTLFQYFKEIEPD